MKGISQIRALTKAIVAPVAQRVAPIRWKEFSELNYWKSRKTREGTLSNDHYKYFYTTHFGLDDGFFENKTILDIGCGPRGSLEWATMASRRIGLDPLADEYLRLGADRHNMEYMNAPSEQIPLPDGECDVVCSFNSLDHVHDIDQTLAEIKRITRVGGSFLLLVEINHPPTDCEPHELTPRQLINALQPEFSCEDLEVYKPVPAGLYDAIWAGDTLPHDTDEPGWLSARFVRVSTI